MSEPESTTTKTLDEMLAELTEEAVRNLSRGADDETSARVKADLPKIAAILALEWITGDRRSETISQQTQSWLTFLYERLYTDEEPSAADIFARFDLPLSRAQYLARMLPAQLEEDRTIERQRRARSERRVVLLAGLETREKRAAESADPGHADTELSLPKEVYTELLTVFDEIASTQSADTSLRPPQRSTTTPGRVYFTIRLATLIALLDFLRKETE